MKIRKTFLLLISIFMLTSTTAYAETKDFIQVTHDVIANDTIVPSDTWSEFFTITNQTSDPIRIRLDRIENVGHSDLYKIIKGTTEGQHESTLDTVSSPWFSLGSKQSKTMSIAFSFPKEAQNEYQGKDFQARLYFVCEAPEGCEINAKGEIVQTGDTTNPERYVLLLLSTGILILGILVWKRKEQ